MTILFAENHEEGHTMAVGNESLEQMPSTFPNPMSHPRMPEYEVALDNSNVNSSYNILTNEVSQTKIESDKLTYEFNNITQSHAESSPVKQYYNEDQMQFGNLSKTISREVSKPVSH